MQNWLKLSLLLSAFGFFKEFRPSEHYIYNFLMDPRWRNITAEEISRDVYPIATYSYLAQLVVVFLITDLCRYKPLIVVLGCSGIVVFSLLLWTSSLLGLQIVELIYGTLMATEVAYYTYMYAKVPKENYQQVTGHARAGILIGRFLSGILSQLFITYDVMNWRDLTYISLGALIIGTIWSLFLPSVQQSIYFHQDGIEKLKFTQKWLNAFKLLFKHFISSYSIFHVIKWSIWWSVSTCGFLLVQTYMQPLWETINVSQSGRYNGAVEAVLTILGTAGALVAGFIKINWDMKGEITLAICSFVEAGILVLASQTEEIFVCYACYIVFGALYHFVITIASAEIAKHILEDSYGLVFGLNTLLALILQSIMIAIIYSEPALNYSGDPRKQFMVFGIYFFIISVFFLVVGIYTLFKYFKNRRSNNIA